MANTHRRLWTMKTYLSIAIIIIIIIIIIINKSYHSAVSYIKNFGNNNERQVGQLSKRDRAAGWVSFGTNFADRSIFNHCDVICLQSYQKCKLSKISTIICDNFETVRDRMSVLINNRKSHSGFRLVPTSVTLNECERRNSPYLRYFIEFDSFADLLRHNG